MGDHGRCLGGPWGFQGGPWGAQGGPKGGPRGPKRATGDIDNFERWPNWGGQGLPNRSKIYKRKDKGLQFLQDWKDWRLRVWHAAGAGEFYCRNVMFWVRPGCPRGRYGGASGRRFWDAKKLQKHCFCCVFSAGGVNKLTKPCAFNELCLGPRPGDTFH